MAYNNPGFQQDDEKAEYEESYPNTGEGNFEQLKDVKKFPKAGAGEPADSMNASWYDEQDRDAYPGTAFGVASDPETHHKLLPGTQGGVCNDGQGHAEKNKDKDPD